MTPDHSSTQHPLGEQSWPRQDSPGDSRGLPGYPHEREPEQSEGNKDPELGFDPDSPDLQDPQIDPKGAPRMPEAPDAARQKRAPDEQYPPYQRD